MFRIAASILSAEFARLGDEAKRVGADRFGQADCKAAIDAMRAELAAPPGQAA